MRLLLLSFDQLLAPLALKLNEAAAIAPVCHHFICAHLYLTSVGTRIQLAGTSVRMLLIVAILEPVRAFRAVEQKVFERVDHVEIGFAARSVLSAAVWTSGLLVRPVDNAWLAVELIAHSALDQVGRDYAQTD